MFVVLKTSEMLCGEVAEKVRHKSDDDADEPDVSCRC
jgi:hypothetical protein